MKLRRTARRRRDRKSHGEQRRTFVQELVLARVCAREARHAKAREAEHLSRAGLAAELAGYKSLERAAASVTEGELEREEAALRTEARASRNGEGAS